MKFEIEKWKLTVALTDMPVFERDERTWRMETLEITYYPPVHYNPRGWHASGEARLIKVNGQPGEMTRGIHIIEGTGETYDLIHTIAKALDPRPESVQNRPYEKV